MIRSGLIGRCCKRCGFLSTLVLCQVYFLLNLVAVLFIVGSVVGALNGPSPAAGCLLALACDYRIKGDNPKFVTGLNETMLGFAAPSWLAQTFVDVVGHRQAYQALLLSNLYSPNDALKIGLVDQVCPVDQLNAEAGKFSYLSYCNRILTIKSYKIAY